ncbi:MAG: hypothetical protein K2Q24_03235 [Chitinophagaceae bacterium]|nr:hypothetical protein [Chitinophagaceae bacterium]
MKSVYFLSALFMSSFFFGACKKLLSPARELEGNWVTKISPTLYYNSDFCGTYRRVARAQIGLRWEITKTGTNTISIDIYRTSSSSVTLLVSTSCAQYVPLTFPISVNGEISSSQLTLTDQQGRIVGSFSFTSDIFTGDFNSTFDKFCGLYCSGVDSDSKAITLIRQ